MNNQSGSPGWNGTFRPSGTVPQGYYVEFGTGRLVPVPPVVPVYPWPAHPPRQRGG